MHLEKAWSASDQPAEQSAKVTAALAEAHFREGQFRLFSAPAEALQHLIDAAELNPEDALYAHHVGLALHRRGEADAALGWYRKALERDPTFRRSAYEICLILRQKKQPFERDPAWKQLDGTQQARLLGTSDSTPVEAGLAAYANGNWEQAQSALERASLQGEALPAKLRGLVSNYLGALAQRNGKPAREYWSAAHNYGTQASTLPYNLGLAYTLQAEAALNDGNFTLALEEAEAGLRLLPDHKRLLDLQLFLRLRDGYQLAEQGKWKQALEIWKPVDTPTGANGRYLAANRALAYEKLEMHKDAAEGWREFARRRPRKSGAEDTLSEAQIARLWSRVSTLYMKAGLVDEAIDSLQTALKYQADDVQLGLALTQRYVEAERDESAVNQVARLYKAHPTNIDVLVLRAEMAEAGIQGRGYYGVDPFMSGIAQWEAVYATHDETYAPVAHERLEALYPEVIDQLEYMGRKAELWAVYERALKTLPDDHLLRAMYVTDLLQIPKRRKEALEQIALIDLLDDDALRQLIDGWHLAKAPAEAAALLDKAEALKPRDFDFYLDIANSAVERERPELAALYQQEALKRASSVQEQQKVRVSVAISHSRTDPKKAIALLKEVVKEDKNCTPAWIGLIIGYMSIGELTTAKQALRDAERAARLSDDPAVMDAVEHVKQVLNSPFAGFPSIGGQPGTAFLPEMVDDEWDDGWDEFEEAEMPGGGFGNVQDFLDNPPDNPPVTDRRRRRMEKQSPPDTKGQA